MQCEEYFFTHTHIADFPVTTLKLGAQTAAPFGGITSGGGLLGTLWGGGQGRQRTLGGGGLGTVRTWPEAHPKANPRANSDRLGPGYARLWPP